MFDDSEGIYEVGAWDDSQWPYCQRSIDVDRLFKWQVQFDQGNLATFSNYL
jgi:hypothetical protein